MCTPIPNDDRALVVDSDSDDNTDDDRTVPLPADDNNHEVSGKDSDNVQDVPPPMRRSSRQWKRLERFNDSYVDFNGEGSDVL